MPDRSIVERVEVLEHKVELLERLPDRMTALELQFVQLRGEMRDGFSAIRDEMQQAGTELRAEMRAGDEETRRFMRVLHEDLITRITTISEGRTRRKRR